MTTVSDVAIKNPKKPKQVSDMVLSLKKLTGQIGKQPSGLYEQRVIIKTGNVKVDNNDLDCEFDIPFDDDTEADEASIAIFNLKKSTIREIKRNAQITVTAGYGKDTGIIFSGFISKVKSYMEGVDRVTEITALDSQKLKERDIESISYAAGTNASYILKDLCQKLGLPIAVFNIKRDYTFEDETTVDGELMNNIKKYARICKVAAYINKSQVYVCPLDHFKQKGKFEITNDTGLLECEEFEEEQTNGEYKDTVKGYEVKMLLQHRITTGCYVHLKNRNMSGAVRVREGKHTYHDNDFLTEFKGVDM